jgi:hypothetical protein
VGGVVVPPPRSHSVWFSTHQVIRCCGLDQPPLRYKHCHRWCEGLAFFSKVVREELHCMQRRSPDRRGRLRLLGPWRNASTEHELRTLTLIQVLKNAI